MGLIVPLERTKSGYRKFALENIKRLHFIRKTQSLNFTLEEIKALLNLSEKPEADCSDIRDCAESKLNDIRIRIADLTIIRDCLKKLADSCPGKAKSL